VRKYFLLQLGIRLAAVLSCAVQPNPLAGAIDIHALAAPHSVPWSIDAIGPARMAKSRGMFGFGGPVPMGH